MADPANPFAVAQAQFDEAAEMLRLAPALRELLRWPRREYTGTIPLRMDDGSVRVLRAHRVQYNDALGPCMGEVRWHASQTPDMVRAQAAWMTWRAAVAHLPLGGAHGAVACDAKQLSPAERERLARGWVRLFAREIGSDRDVPFPGVNTTPEVMAWMRDEYETLTGRFSPAVVTGKPLALGGSLGRAEATARGGVSCVRQACAQLGIAPDGAYAVQGFGNAGQHAALVHREILGGGRLVAVSDTSGGVFDPGGLDPAALVAHKQKTGRLAGFAGARPIANADLLELDVAVLYPAALETVITRQNADRVRARVVCELADGPTTPEADRILHLNGTQVIPDLLASAGAVTASYLEHVQGLSNSPWSLEEVNRQIDARMRAAYEELLRMQKARNVLPRTAACLVAVSRVAEAAGLRGWA